MASEYKQCECGNGFSTTTGSSLCHQCRKEGGLDTPHARRRLREQNAAGSHTAKQWFARIEFQNYLCFWCFEDMRDSAQIFRGTKGHVIPLCRGGSDYIENIVAECAPCNREKGTKTGTEYRDYLAKISEYSTLTASKEAGFYSPAIRISATSTELREAIFGLSGQKKMPGPERKFAERRKQLAVQAEMASLVFRGVPIIDVTVRRAQLKAQIAQIEETRKKA